MQSRELMERFRVTDDARTASARQQLTSAARDLAARPAESLDAGELAALDGLLATVGAKRGFIIERIDCLNVADELRRKIADADESKLKARLDAALRDLEAAQRACADLSYSQDQAARAHAADKLGHARSLVADLRYRQQDVVGWRKRLVEVESKQKQLGVA
jgi:hypothetical protein